MLAGIERLGSRLIAESYSVAMSENSQIEFGDLQEAVAVSIKKAGTISAARIPDWDLKLGWIVEAHYENARDTAQRMDPVLRQL